MELFVLEVPAAEGAESETRREEKQARSVHSRFASFDADGDVTRWNVCLNSRRRGTTRDSDAAIMQ